MAPGWLLFGCLSPPWQHQLTTCKHNAEEEGSRKKSLLNIAVMLLTVYIFSSDSFCRQQVQALLGQFSQAEDLLRSVGVQPGSLDGVLLDAGCSSMQLDTPERGFSLRKDGPLDMRMDGDRYPDMPTAADVVNALDQQALASILRTYGEERHARKVASAVVQARSIYPITRTQQLASIVAVKPVTKRDFSSIDNVIFYVERAEQDGLFVDDPAIFLD
ncbi:putative methyltransferase-like protein 15 [Varanus komodoensis]|nr:putative methyltransferase-like protein 15 [Varanus komodoensis]